MFAQIRFSKKISSFSKVVFFLCGNQSKAGPSGQIILLLQRNGRKDDKVKRQNECDSRERYNERLDKYLMLITVLRQIPLANGSDQLCECTVICGVEAYCAINIRNVMWHLSFIRVIHTIEHILLLVYDCYILITFLFHIFSKHYTTFHQILP